MIKWESLPATWILRSAHVKASMSAHSTACQQALGLYLESESCDHPRAQGPCSYPPHSTQPSNTPAAALAEPWPQSRSQSAYIYNSLLRDTCLTSHEVSVQDFYWMFAVQLVVAFSRFPGWFFFAYSRQESKRKLDGNVCLYTSPSRVMQGALGI